MTKKSDVVKLWLDGMVSADEAMAKIAEDQLTETENSKKEGGSKRQLLDVVITVSRVEQRPDGEPYSSTQVFRFDYEEGTWDDMLGSISEYAVEGGIMQNKV